MPCRTGVLLPLEGCDGPPNRSGPAFCWLTKWEGWFGAPWSPPEVLEGKGLLRMSLRVDVEDDGVRTGDWFASRPEADDDGEAVPSLDSLFFFGLFESLPRDNWACRKGKGTS